MKDVVDGLKVGIIGLTPEAGAGFVASCLARVYVTERRLHPVVLELGGGALYDSLGMERHFAGDLFFSYHGEAVKERSLRYRGNIRFGVNWMLLTPDADPSALELHHRMRLLANCRGDVVLAVLSGLTEAEIGKILPEMDVALVVIDPLPSRLIAGRERLCILRTLPLPTVYVVNKYNAGIDRRELQNYLRLGEPLRLPQVPPEIIYASEYACRVTYDLEQAETLLKKPLIRLIAGIEAAAEGRAERRAGDILEQ